MIDLREKLSRLDKLDRLHQALEQEALRVYRPMPQQLEVHTSGTAFDLLVRGGKRSGKSTSAAIEFARRVTGEPIYGPDGQPLDMPWRVPTKQRPGIYWIIGWDQRHIGETIHRLLFEPGLFDIIQDEVTGRWRPFNENHPADVERQHLRQPCGPVIPSRLIEEGSFSWENKAEKQFKGVRLTSGAKIFAYWSSALAPKQGDPVDGIWIDEDIQFASHIKEWQDRLRDRRGWLIWSVWPHVKNYALIELLDRAEEQADDPAPRIKAVQLIASENMYCTPEAHQLALERMGSEEDIARRDRGELMLDELSMYDFYPAFHLVRRRPERVETIVTPRDVIEAILTSAGRLPPEWTRYLAIDPAHTRTAVLSGVVPPPSWLGVKVPPVVIIEWELVSKKHSPHQLAAALLPLMQGFVYEAFIMDQNAGRQHTIGSDHRSVFELYSEAFRAQGLLSRVTGSGFSPGLNKPQLRYAMVRQQMELRSDIPGMLLFDEQTRHMQREFHTYVKKRNDVKGELDESAKILDEPANPRKHDVMAALEYLVSYLNPLFRTNSAYVPPSETPNLGSPAYQHAMQLLAEQNKQRGDYVHLGPGVAA